MTGRLFVFSPTYRPVGGVVKLFDYARHALDLGIEPVFCIPERIPADAPLLRIERFRPLAPDAGIRHTEGYSVGIGPGDLSVFSWPPQYEVIAPRLDPGTPVERVIHLVQNVRHADPDILRQLVGDLHVPLRLRAVSPCQLDPRPGDLGLGIGPVLVGGHHRGVAVVH
jgi:hypothetical protein